MLLLGISTAMEINPENYRPYLFTVAYNILGEVQEAEDIVQEAFAYYLSLQEGQVQNLKSYLSRVVANKAIDRLKELKKQRESYPGVWLPEPFVHQSTPSKASEKDILSFEALSALESLNPVERAVFVLREAFSFPFSELAVICNTTEANCRQILSRTRQKISSLKNSKAYPDEQLVSLMQTFLQAIVEEDTATLTRLLKEDIVLYSDGGGKAAAAVNPLWGRELVSKFLIGIARKNKERSLSLSFVQVNQKPAVLLSSPQGPESLISFAGDGENFSQIFITRNPDKLFFKSLSQKE